MMSLNHGDLLKCKVAAIQTSVAGEEPDSDDDLEVEEDGWSDDGLVEALETLNKADGFRDHAFDNSDDDSIYDL